MYDRIENSDAKAVLLVYDITNYESFQNAEDWLRLVRRTFKDGPMPTLALVGNKSASSSKSSDNAVDLYHMRTVPAEKHREMTEENEMMGYFVSAKTGDKVRHVEEKTQA